MSGDHFGTKGKMTGKRSVTTRSMARNRMILQDHVKRRQREENQKRTYHAPQQLLDSAYDLMHKTIINLCVTFHDYASKEV